jgi:hypothetical protein
MPVHRQNEEERVALVDAILKHLRQLEKDTAKMIASLERERARPKEGWGKATKKR